LERERQDAEENGDEFDEHGFIAATYGPDPPVFRGPAAEPAWVPNQTIRCVFNLTCFEWARHRFYSNAEQQWRSDSDIILRKDIAHEFGHAVGMFNAPDNVTKMSIMSEDQIQNNRFAIPVPEYSQTNRAQFSVKEPRR
jgi:hypothetical protein